MFDRYKINRYSRKSNTIHSAKEYIEIKKRKSASQTHKTKKSWM